MNSLEKTETSYCAAQARFYSHHFPSCMHINNLKSTHLF